MMRYWTLTIHYISRASEKFLKSDLKNKFWHEESVDRDNQRIVIIDRYDPNNVIELIRMAIYFSSLPKDIS